MRWVVEYDRRGAAQFVACVGHPEPAAVVALKDAAILRVEHNSQVAAYFWFVWTRPDEMALYACADESVRRRWTRQDLGELHKFPQFLGARRLIARPPDRRIAALLRTCGWRGRVDGTYGVELPSKWSARYGRAVSHHLSATEDQRATATTGADAR